MHLLLKYHWSHSEKFINHLLDQVSFIREQIKSKYQQINSSLEHASKRDDIYLSKKHTLFSANEKYRTEIRPGTKSIHTTDTITKK